MSLFATFKKALGFPEEYEDLDDLADLEDTDDNDDTEDIGEHADGSASVATATQGEAAAKVRHSTTREGAQDSSSAEKLPEEFAAVVENQRRKFESIRLSAERQKRALNGRIADMERQIRDLEAEREQLQLENSSMVNRLRGASMPVVSHADGGEIRRLNEENAKLRNELNNVKRQLTAAERRVNELGGADAPTKEELTRLENRLKDLTALNEATEKETGRLTELLSIAESSNKELGERLTAANIRADRLEEQVTQLNKTIETNLTDHALAEEEYRREIKRLTALVNQHNDMSQAPKKRGRKKKNEQPAAETPSLLPEAPVVKISAIDELMDNTDWFAAPEPGPRIKDPEVMESFGYKEQPKKPNKKIDENQLTLF